MKFKELPERKDVPVEYTWNLSDIFESDEAWRAEFEALGKLPGRISAYSGTLGESAGNLLDFMKLRDEMELRLSKLYSYASCKSDQDTADGFYMDMRGKAMSVLVAISGAAAFFTPELISLDDDTIEDFFKTEPALEVYRRVISKARRVKEHTLSPAEEKLLAAMGEIADGPDNIGGVFRDADLKFRPAVDSEGKEHALSSGSYVPLLESSDRKLRQDAFAARYEQLSTYKNTFAAILNAEFKQRRFFADTRKYPDTLTAALDRTEVPVEVYTNLIETVHKNLDKMYRYVALRKKLLGVDELHMYDVYTPVVADVAAEINFEQAKENVLEALAVLGEDYVEMLKEGFNNRWIDVYENKGKRSGAYSSGNAFPHPYVLLNQNDTLDNMFTLAHEMGHALHSYLSCKHQPICTADYVIFVAEVASTCNEILLMRHMLSKTEDKKQRAYLINHFLDSFKGTVYRQTMFAEFELMLGHMAESGETLTADVLCEKYLALNKLYFGPDMVSDDEIALEWTVIPHFFYNYYVFQYATGFSAAVAIANRIRDLGDIAVEEYKKFLSSGSSADPISLLKIAGVDMSSPEPVNSALSLFGELIEEMEKLV